MTFPTVPRYKATGVIRYSLRLQRSEQSQSDEADEQWEARRVPGPAGVSSVELESDPGQIVEGDYIVTGPSIVELTEPCSFEDAVSWLIELHGSEGKEPGNGIKPFTVFRSA